jgi:hypothetical protein
MNPSKPRQITRHIIRQTTKARWSAQALLGRLRRDDRGSILTEIALAMPLYISVLMGTVETGNFLLTHLKVQHTVVSVADLITRDEDISEDVIEDIFLAVPQIMAPFHDSGKTVAIVSAISQNEDTPASIFWQRHGGGTLAKSSSFGDQGDALASLPAGLTLRDNETILATEIYFSYEPLIFTFIEAQTIYKASYFRPRIGALQEVLP